MNLRDYFPIILCTLLCVNCDGAKILGVFHLPSPSHHIIIGALFRELVARGHEVVIISPYPSSEKIANYTDIEIEGMLESLGTDRNCFFNDDGSYFTKIKRMHKTIQEYCEYALASKGLNDLLNSGAKFDLMITTYIMCEAMLGVAHHFDVPVITFMPQSSNVIMDHLFGNSAPYAYVPNPMLPVSYPMTFFDRLKNTLVNTFMDVAMNWYALQAQDELLQKHFPGAPSLEIVKERVQVGFFASHPSIETPRPYMPNMVQIGGLHMERPEELPVDLQRFLDEAKNGVIYFNFGSIIKSSELPKNSIKSLLEAFKGRSEMVLWKFEETLEELPKNVVIKSWIPQRGVLSHPNVKVFITHGGLGSITESIYNGIPMLCIPIFSDQFSNCERSSDKGYAIIIELSNLTQQNLNHALDEIINKPQYRAKISARSHLFKSQPISAMDKAIFWIDHVVKHKGAEHLKSPARLLNWYQLMLLDVIGFILVVLVMTVGVVYCIISLVWRFIKRAINIVRKKNNGDRKKKKNE